MSNSKFQFQGYNITRSLIERTAENPDLNVSIAFSPQGVLNKANNQFKLNLSVKITDKKETYNIEIDVVAVYTFENIENSESLLYINAPALVFPYIRAYISTLTTLSGLPTVMLPTMNLTEVGKELKNNIKILD